MPVVDITPLRLQNGVRSAGVPAIRGRFGEQIGVSQVVAEAEQFVPGAGGSNDGEFFPKRQEERGIARPFRSADEEDFGTDAS